jgi:phosphoglycerate dehydrogenase-like enzyme
VSRKEVRGIAIYTRVARAGVVARLKRLSDYEVVEPATLQDLVSAVGRVQALVIADPVGPEGAAIASALRAADCPVRWVQITSAGVDGLLKHEIPEHIVVTVQGGGFSVPVAEHAVALLLGLGRQLFEIGRRSQAGTWNRVFDPPLVSLEAMTVVIVGMGHIGREVARRLRSFGTRIVGVTRSGNDEPLAHEVAPMAELAKHLGQADAVVVTVALAPATRGLFDAAMFEACKPGVLFVNVSRGEIVDQVALKGALDSGHLAGAALDVTSPEPLPADHALWHARNVNISPHIAGAGSAPALARIADVVEDNAKRFLQGQALLHRVR